MVVYRNPAQHFELRFLRALVNVGCVASGVASQIRTEAQPLIPLRPVCLDMASTTSLKKQLNAAHNKCCHQGKGSCLPWQQLFPAEALTRPAIHRPSSEGTYTPRLDEYGNNIAGSQGAAKDAVIQLGITKALDAIAPLASVSPQSSAGPARRPNLFQRAEKTYRQILGPRTLKSGTVLTPQIEMNMNLGDVSVNSLKLGVGVKF
jgi:hypothetical protein